MRIAHDHIALATWIGRRIDAQAAGPAVAVIGRVPGDAEVFAVAIERLDAGRHIDNVEPIIRPDGDGAWLDKFAPLDAALAPDDFRRAAGPAAACGEGKQDRQPASSKATPRHDAASVKCTPLGYQVA